MQDAFAVATERAQTDDEFLGSDYDDILNELVLLGETNVRLRIMIKDLSGKVVAIEKERDQATQLAKGYAQTINFLTKKNKTRSRKKPKTNYSNRTNRCVVSRLDDVLL